MNMKQYIAFNVYFLIIINCIFQSAVSVDGSKSEQYMHRDEWQHEFFKYIVVIIFRKIYIWEIDMFI